MSLIDESHGRMVRMAHLAVVASHTVNGVAKLHSELMKQTIFSDFADLYPDRFTNVTNGIAVRRWLKQSNPGSRRCSPSASATRGRTTSRSSSGCAGRRTTRGSASASPRSRPRTSVRLAETIQRRVGIEVDPDSLFDVQVKRIHEYKRQLLNLLYVITRYNRIRANPEAPVVPRTVIFAGKAAPGYTMAKDIIKLINNVARVVNTDRAVAGQAQGRVPARLRRVARAAHHAGGRPFASRSRPPAWKRRAPAT